MTERVNVVVVGAGISGLCAALAARRAGLRVVLLESGGVPGGVIRSSMQDGFVIEGGPNSFHSNERTDALITSLGIEGEKIHAQVAARRRYIVRQRKLHEVPTSPLSLLKSSLLSPTAKLRMLAEIAIPARTSPEDESLGSLVRRRLGKEALDYLVDPFVSGVYAGDPARLSSAFAMKMLSRFEREHGGIVRGMLAGARKPEPETSRAVMTSFRGGMQVLPLAIGAELGDALRLRHRVQRIARAGEEWVVSGDFGGEAFTLQSSQLIVATAAHALSAMDWPAEVMRTLARVTPVRYAPLATVTFGYRQSQVRHSLNGFGALVPAVEQTSILGVLFNSSTFCCRAPERHVLLTAFVGGARCQELPPAEQARERAHRELSELLGITGEPVTSQVASWPRAIPQFDVGHSRVVQAVAELTRQLPGLQFVGSYIDGVSVGECAERGANAGAGAALQVARHA